MKLRPGFVSNSSTTHFVAIGWRLNDDDIKDYIEKVHPEWMKCETFGRFAMRGMFRDIGRGEPIIETDRGIVLGIKIGSSGQDGSPEDLDGTEITTDVVRDVEIIGKRFGYRKPSIIFDSYTSD